MYSYPSDFVKTKLLSEPNISASFALDIFERVKNLEFQIAKKDHEIEIKDYEIKLIEKNTDIKLLNMKVNRLQRDLLISYQALTARGVFEHYLTEIAYELKVKGGPFDVRAVCSGIENG